MPDNGAFGVYHFRFEVEAVTPIVLPAYPGPSFRAALFTALQRHFCPIPQTEPASAEHKAACPACWLMATERTDSPRGRDVPRPYTIEPPAFPAAADADPAAAEPWRLEPGRRFGYGVTLFARALGLLPYLVAATPLMGEAGIGLPLAENAPRGGTARRGRFALRRIDATNPLTGRAAPVLEEGRTTVRVPDAPVTAGDIEAAALALAEGMGERACVSLCFSTPTRIIDEGRIAHRPRPGPLFRRLLERLDALRGEYAGEPPAPDRESLIGLAERVRPVRDLTRWVDLQSGSRRLGRTTPVGGFTGCATYEADRDTWRSLLPYLLWGQEVHVGKDATKGNGSYEVLLPDGGER